MCVCVYVPKRTYFFIIWDDPSEILLQNPFAWLTRQQKGDLPVSHDNYYFVRSKTIVVHYQIQICRVTQKNIPIIHWSYDIVKDTQQFRTHTAKGYSFQAIDKQNTRCQVTLIIGRTTKNMRYHLYALLLSLFSHSNFFLTKSFSYFRSIRQCWGRW